MNQLSSNSESQKRFIAIVNLATSIGFGTPLIPWAWHKLAEPIKLTPIVYKQLIHGDRPLSSLILPSEIMIIVVLVTIYYVWSLNKWRKDFLDLYKEEAIEFKNTPFRTLITLVKITLSAFFVGGISFLVSKFIIFNNF